MKRDPLARMKELVNYATAPMLAVDEKSTIILANKSILSLFGYEKTDLVGKKLDILIPKEHTGDHKKYIKEFFKGASRHVNTMQGCHKDGTNLCLDIIVDVIEDSKGKKYAVANLRNKNGRIELKRKVDSAYNALKKVSSKF